MFSMCIVRGSVFTGKCKLCSVYVLTEDAFLQGSVSYSLYVYG